MFKFQGVNKRIWVRGRIIPASYSSVWQFCIQCKHTFHAKFVFYYSVVRVSSESKQCYAYTSESDITFLEVI